jgi:hypothetical protein
MVSRDRPHADLVQRHEASDVYNREHVHADGKAQSDETLWRRRQSALILSSAASGESISLSDPGA